MPVLLCRFCVYLLGDFHILCAALAVLVDGKGRPWRSVLHILIFCEHRYNDPVRRLSRIEHGGDLVREDVDLDVRSGRLQNDDSGTGCR